MVKHMTFLKFQKSMSLKHGHVSDPSANRLGTDGRDRIIKLLFKNGSEMSKQDEALTSLHTQLV